MKVSTLSKWAGAATLALAVLVSPLHSIAQGNSILKPEDTHKLLPASVYYKAQSAPTQLRNSGGVKFADGYYLLATMVDTSGYSSDVATKYQAYFITEVPIRINGQSLPAGVYGIGFVTGDQFVVTDVGAHDVLTVAYSTDDAIKRPLPLQFTTDPAGGFRLYTGRKYVTIAR